MTSAHPSLSLFATPDMARVFSLSRQLQHMTRFEWALSVALEANGFATGNAASAIEPLLDAAFVDLPTLLEQAHQSGNLAIPFVRQLTAAVRLGSEDAARSVHWGATSQDLLDTALVLQMREALALIGEDLQRLDQQLLQRVQEHAHTVMAGRTWLQQGPPITLGLKIAGWLAAIRRHRERLQAAGRRALVLQFGGAVGTLAALGEKGTAVSAHLAQTLGLTEPDLPWHTHRDNLVEVATALGLLAGTLGKIARDVSLLMETEVAEVSEPWTEGRGGSSTMPHKRNPVASAIVLAAVARIPGLVSTLLAAMVQEHERGLGGWHAEWETLPEVFFLAAAALARVLEIVNGLEVHPGRMLANLEEMQGLALSEAVSVALAAGVGRARAHELVEEACRRTIAENRPLRDVLLESPQICRHLSQADIDRLLDPRNYLGSAQCFIARVIGAPDDSH